MKVLVVGPTTPGFDSGYNKAVSKAFELLDCQVKLLEFSVTTPTGTLNRLLIDLPMTFGNRINYEKYITTFNATVRSAFSDFRPDMVFVIRGSKLEAETLAYMSGCTKILWCQDRVHRCDLSREQLKSYDSIYVFDKCDIQSIRQNHAIEAKFLPLALDPFIYKKKCGVTKDIDVFFVGTHYPKRRAILEKIDFDFPQLRMKFYGRYVRYREFDSYRRYFGYALKGRLATFNNRSMNPAEINSMYNRSKININIHHQQSEEGCNPRVFEISGAGGFQLTDDISYIKQEFNNLITTYSDYDALKGNIERFVRYDNERELLATSSMELVLSRHTFLHRILFVIQDMGFKTISPGAALSRQQKALHI
jgi:spore maturation protein CgeB